MTHMNKYKLLFLLAVLLLSPPSFGEDDSYSKILTQTPSGMPLFRLTLDESADIAIKNSHTLAAQTEMASAAEETAGSAKTKIYPQLSLQGQTKYASKIGQVSIPGGGAIEAGTHYSWSVGPVLDWVVWDAGQLAKTAKSLKYTFTAQNLEAESTRRDVILNSRMAYFGVQLASEQLKLVNDALLVAKSQFSDVSERYNVGSASRLDFVTAHQDVMDFEKSYNDAAQELAVQLRNLFAVLGLDQVSEPTFPADVSLTAHLKSPPIQPDFLIDLEPIPTLIAKMMPRAEGKVEIEKHPAYESAFQTTNAAKLSYEAAKAQHWPTLNFQGKALYEYPNFAVKERVQQNMLSLGLNLPVIDWGMISKQARSEKHKRNAAAEQMKETGITLSKNLSQAKDQIVILKKSCEAAAAKSRDATEAAGLVYEEYNVGRVIFLEVQRANNRALQAKVDEARTNAALLGQLARMESLITSGGLQ